MLLRREYVKVEIRNLQSLLVCSIILWKSSLTRVGMNFWLTVLTGISGPRLCQVFHSLHEVTCVPLRWKSKDWILLHEEDASGFTKRFPIYHACPKRPIVAAQHFSRTAERSLRHCSLKSEKNQRTWDKLITLMKKVCYQLSPFSHEQELGNPCTNHVQICLKNGNQVATWKTSESGFSLKDKKSKFSAEVRSEIQKHEFQADSDTSIQELTEIIDSQRMEIDHTLTGCEQSKRYQLLLQEEMSQQNRALRETCIRNMRDMEELQKSHVLKVEELSRRKLTEDFEAATSFFQGSNVKTVYNLGDNDAKYPDAEIHDEHTRNSLASPLYLQEREASASQLQVYHLQKRKLVSRCTINFSKYAETRYWMPQKAQI